MTKNIRVLWAIGIAINLTVLILISPPPVGHPNAPATSILQNILGERGEPNLLMSFYEHFRPIGYFIFIAFMLPTILGLCYFMESARPKK